MGSLLLAVASHAQQQVITIAENTLKVGAFSEEIFYYGLAEGDQLIFNFEEQKGKELKEVEIIEMPGASRFMDYKTKKIENKVVQVHKSGIYKFRFANNALGGRICKFKLERIPATEETARFNTTVFWKTVYDSVERRVQEPYLVKKEHKTVSLAGPENYFINSASNALFKGGSTRVTIPVALPPNTVEWYYSFSATRKEEEIKQTKQGLQLAAQVTKLLSSDGGITSLAIDKLIVPPGGNVCDIFLLDAANKPLFDQKTAFKHYPEGSRENLMQGSVKIKSKNLQQYFIGIKNPDHYYGVHVAIEVVAIVLEEQWATREVIRYEVTPRQVAYLTAK